jgi:hypothetical protein
MKELFAIIASLLAVAGNVPYLRDVLTKKITPHPYTWLVWSIVSAITFFGLFVKGGGIGALPVAVAEGFTVIIFLCSLRNGFAHIEKTDHYYLAAALLGLIPWLLTKDPTISVIVAVAIDLIAFVPTIRKTWRRPQSEQSSLFVANVLRHILVIASLQSYNIATMLHSIAMIVTNTVMSGIILGKRRPK